jgi:hypothetical protein
MNKCKYKVVYNPIKYQEDEEDINTCGRHCVFRILNLMAKGRNLYDEIVAEYIDKT